MARRSFKRSYSKKRKFGGGSSSYSKRSTGQFKAAKQQTDQASFAVNIPTQITARAFKVSETANGESQVRGTYPLNIYDLLRKSEFYQSYANMYDEFKIDNIKVKLIPVKFNVALGGNNNNYQTFTAYTAWDRTGLNSKQLYLKVDTGRYNNDPIYANNPNGPKNNDFIGKAADKDGLYCIVGDDVTTYSSAESRQITSGTNTTITRWLKPKTIGEKSQWLSTSSLKTWYYKYDTTDACFRQIPIEGDTATFQKSVNLATKDVAAFGNTICPVAGNNPCYLLEDPSISFKPTLLVGLYPVENEGENSRSVTFNVECEVACSFRGLRKSKVVTAENANDFNTANNPKLVELTTNAVGEFVRTNLETERPDSNLGFSKVTVTNGPDNYIRSTLNTALLTEELVEAAATQIAGNAFVGGPDGWFDIEVFQDAGLSDQQGHLAPGTLIPRGYKLATKWGIYNVKGNGEYKLQCEQIGEGPKTWILPAGIRVNNTLDRNVKLNRCGYYGIGDNDGDVDVDVFVEASQGGGGGGAKSSTDDDKKGNLFINRIEKKERAPGDDFGDLSDNEYGFDEGLLDPEKAQIDFEVDSYSMGIFEIDTRPNITGVKLFYKATNKLGSTVYGESDELPFSDWNVYNGSSNAAHNLDPKHLFMAIYKTSRGYVIYGGYNKTNSRELVTLDTGMLYFDYDIADFKAELNYPGAVETVEDRAVDLFTAIEFVYEENNSTKTFARIEFSDGPLAENVYLNYSILGDTGIMYEESLPLHTTSNHQHTVLKLNPDYVRWDASSLGWSNIPASWEQATKTDPITTNETESRKGQDTETMEE